ncbi:MAG: MFS transporter [Alphaproteobacteria bacterium]
MRAAGVATGAMLAQHAFSSMTKAAIPVAAPVMLPALALDPAFLGVLMGLISVSAFLTMLGAGCFIRRYGGLRLGQVALAVNGAFTALLAVGAVPLMLLSAFAVGTGVGISTPAGSQVVARQSPPRLAPLMFSIKQTAVPIGIVTAGLLVPVLAVVVGWQGALLAISACCVLLLVLLQPLRARLDADRDPGARLHVGDMLTTVRGVFGDPAIRELALAAFAFLGLQAVFTAFFVSYLTVGLGFSLVVAGTALSIALSVAVFSRILWGWIAGRVSPRFVLALIGLAAGLTTVLLALAGPSWGILPLTALGVGISATAVAWHGVLLAEVARLAPPGTAGAMCGGAIAVGLVAEAAFPLLFAGLLVLTGSFVPGFLAAAALPLAVGALLLRPARVG